MTTMHIQKISVGILLSTILGTLPVIAATDLVHKGRTNLNKGNVKVALSNLESAVKSEPNSCEAHFLLGQTYCKLKKMVQAKQQYRAAIRVGKGSVYAQKANVALLKLPQTMTAPRTGPSTKTLFSSLSELGFDRGNDNKPTVINFYASWCAPCKQLEATLDKAKDQYEDKISFKSIDVDDPANQKMLDQYEVSPIPTVIFLSPQGEVVGYVVGFADNTAVQSEIKKILPAG